MFDFLEEIKRENPEFFYTFTSYKNEYIISAVLNKRKFGGKFTSISDMKTTVTAELTKELTSNGVKVLPF